jgi:hypothetical protein
MQNLAIIFEDAVQSLYRAWIEKRRGYRTGLALWWRKLGYVWVVLWFALCSPPPLDMSAKKQKYQDWDKLLLFELLGRYFFVEKNKRFYIVEFFSRKKYST